MSSAQELETDVAKSLETMKSLFGGLVCCFSVLTWEVHGTYKAKDFTPQSDLPESYTTNKLNARSRAPDRAVSTSRTLDTRGRLHFEAFSKNLLHSYVGRRIRYDREDHVIRCVCE